MRENCRKILFWGMGNTAKAMIEDIGLMSENIIVMGFTSSIPSETEDKYFYGYTVLTKSQVLQEEFDYLCILSSPEREWEIRYEIYCINQNLMKKIISIKELMMIAKLGGSLEENYKELKSFLWGRGAAAINRRYVLEELKRNYSGVLFEIVHENERYIDDNAIHTFDPEVMPIFVMWLQGMENAPEVVKTCFKSIEKAVTDRDELVVLDESNLHDYILLPDHIEEKWKKGIISNAHYSDIVRLDLLNRYGGMWIDATVYLMEGRIPENIRKRDFFMFSSQLEMGTINYDPHFFANWFIKSYRNNKYLYTIYSLILEYWKRENTLMDYFFFHVFGRMVYEYGGYSFNDYDVMPRDTAQLLWREKNREFSIERYEEIKSLSEIQKLDYKGTINKKNGTFWKYMVDNT